MNKKIIAIGIISMFLLTSIISLSVLGKVIVENKNEAVLIKTDNGNDDDCNVTILAEYSAKYGTYITNIATFEIKDNNHNIKGNKLKVNFTAHIAFKVKESGQMMKVTWRSDIELVKIKLFPDGDGKYLKDTAVVEWHPESPWQEGMVDEYISFQFELNASKGLYRLICPIYLEIEEYKWNDENEEGEWEFIQQIDAINNENCTDRDGASFTFSTSNAKVYSLLLENLLERFPILGRCLLSI